MQTKIWKSLHRGIVTNECVDARCGGKWSESTGGIAPAAVKSTKALYSASNLKLHWD